MHRCAVLLCLCTLALLATGAMVTSEGKTATPFARQIHLVTAAPVGVLALCLALWLMKASPYRWHGGLGWLAAATVLVQVLLGRENPAAAPIHAWVAQLFFALTVAIAVVTSRSWVQDNSPAVDTGRLRLRTLSMVAVVLMVLQVGLGAAVRHNDMGAVPHIVGALVVTIVLLLLAILVTHQFPEHPVLNPPAKALIGLTFTQVMLGMTAFIARLMADESSLAVTIPSVTHVALGALTLGTTVMLALQIRRHVRVAA